MGVRLGVLVALIPVTVILRGVRGSQCSPGCPFVWRDPHVCAFIIMSHLCSLWQVNGSLGVSIAAAVASFTAVCLYGVDTAGIMIYCYGSDQDFYTCDIYRVLLFSTSASQPQEHDQPASLSDQSVISCDLYRPTRGRGSSVLWKSYLKTFRRDVKRE